jgi:hypothetical protein
MNSRFASVLFVAATLLAGTSHAAVDQPQSVKLDRATIVGTTVLPAGTYKLELVAGSDTARFVQGKRVVAEAPCKIGLAQVMYPGTAVHYRTSGGGQDRLLKIVFSSSKLAVEFPTATDVAAGAPAEKTAQDRR